MKRTWALFVCVPAVSAALFVAACGDDDVVVSKKPDAGPVDATVGDTFVPDSGGTDSGNDAGQEKITPTVLASFNAAMGQLPEGVVVQSGSPIVGFAPLGTLVRVLPDGGTTDFAALSPTASMTYTTGLALDGQGNVYIAVGDVSGSSTGVPPAGVYKVAADGGTPVLYNTTGDTTVGGFLNGLDFNGTDLYASDSAGKIFKIASNGAATLWKSDAELQGDKAACSSQNPFPIGVNGIAHDNTYVYGVNLDKGSFFRIKIDADAGTPGPVEVLYKNCDFFGADGLWRDTDGTFLVANNGKSRIDRVTVTGAAATFKTLAMGAPLDGPASLFVDGTGASKKLYITNSAFGSAATDGGMPKPGLLSASVK